MKQLFLALFLTGIMFTANAATIETPAIFTVPATEQKPIDANYVWELRFSCDGGNTWGTMCCFSSQQEAIDFWNANEDMLCGWTIE